MRVTVTIPKKYTRGAELVAVPRKDYAAFEKYQMEVADALKKIRRGNQSYRTGRTRKIRSVVDLLS